MQHAEQIRLRHFRGPETALAQFAIDGNQRHQHEADRGEMAEAGDIVGPVRVHQRIDLGQLLRRIGDGRSRRRTCRASSPPPAPRGWWCRNRRSPAASRPCPRACAPLRCWGRSLRTAGPEYGSADRARNGADARRAAPPRSRHRRRSRRRSRPSRRARRHRRCAGAAASICGDGEGIGHQLADGRIEEILDRIDLDAAAGDHPRQHLRQLVALRDRKRARRPRASSRSRQSLPVAERTTPRKACGASMGNADAGSVMMLSELGAKPRRFNDLRDRRAVSNPSGRLSRRNPWPRRPNRPWPRNRISAAGRIRWAARRRLSSARACCAALRSLLWAATIITSSGFRQSSFAAPR